VLLTAEAGDLGGRSDDRSSGTSIIGGVFGKLAGYGVV